MQQMIHKLLFISLSILFLGLKVDAQTTTDLYCKYDFNQNSDRVGVFGTDQADFNTASLTSDRFGNVDQAYDFTASNTEIITYPLRNFTNIDNDEFSLSCWVKLEPSNAARRTIISHYYSASCGDNREFVLNLESDDSLRLSIYEAGSNPGYYYIKFGSINDNLWHHVSISYELVNSVPSFVTYLDGAVQTIGTNVANPMGSWAGITGGSARTGIGAFAQIGTGVCGSIAQGMDGAIDDIYFYSKILTAAEVLINYNASNPSRVKYVDINATGANDGSSWADAYTNINTAILFLNDNDSLFVAEGTYSITALGLNLTAENIAIFGGFSSFAQTLATRDWLIYPTILNGDVSGNDIYPMTNSNLTSISDNPDYILQLTANNIEIDGLVIRGAKKHAIYSKDHGTNTTNMVLRNCEISHSSARGTTVGGGAWGIGLYVSESNSLTHDLTIENCNFHDIYGRYAVPFQVSTHNNTIINVDFVNNLVHNNHTADLINNGYNAGSGGSFAAFDGSTINAQIINSTFTENTNGGANQGASQALIMAGEELSQGATLNIASYNSIYWNNNSTRTFEEFSTGYEKMQNLTMTNNITADIMDNTYAVAFTETGALQSDPMFVDANAQDFKLDLGSPAIEAGTITGIANLIPTIDLAKNPRTVYNFIDLGAYENQLYSAISKVDEHSELSIFPNPVGVTLTLPFHENIESISIYNLNGSLIKKMDNTSPIITVEDLPQGMYILTVLSNEKLSTGRFVKK